MTPDPEQMRAEFEREKWLVDVELRRRELDLREREQANRDAETQLKRAEQASSRWRSPLVVAILAGAVAASGNAVVAWVNGSLQRDLENPRLGEASARASDPKLPYIRILANDRKFSEFKNIRDDSPTMPYEGGEIWGGALWAIRDRLGREAADSIIAAAWRGMAWPAAESERAPAFVRALLTTAAAKGSTQSAAVAAVLRAREFPVGG